MIDKTLWFVLYVFNSKLNPHHKCINNNNNQNNIFIYIAQQYTNAFLSALQKVESQPKRISFELSNAYVGASLITRGREFQLCWASALKELEPQPDLYLGH